MKPRLRRADVAADPNLLWNQFISILATSDRTQLDDVERSLSLIFWYESEVQNGGHLQYFLNQPGSATETIAALVTMGAPEYASTLMEALTIWSQTPSQRATTISDYSGWALEGRFTSLDERFYRLAPSLIELLEKHLNANVSAHFDMMD
jgi:hypothetical protein